MANYRLKLKTKLPRVSRKFYRLFHHKPYRTIW
jgi:hypothetical protein